MIRRREVSVYLILLVLIIGGCFLVRRILEFFEYGDARVPLVDQVVWASYLIWRTACEAAAMLFELIG